MKLFIIYVFNLIFFICLTNAVQCPSGYQYSQGNGCRNGNLVISSTYCNSDGEYERVSNLQLGVQSQFPLSCPASYHLRSFNNHIINNNQVSLFLCINEFDEKTYYTQVGNCNSGDSEVKMPDAPTRTIYFTNTNRYMIVAICQSPLSVSGDYDYDLMVNSAPNPPENPCFGDLVSFLVWDYGTTVCPVGFTGALPDCSTDIDECSTGAHNCVSPATCVNSYGSFSCVCNVPGYRLSGDGKGCVDINECVEKTDQCSEICTNSQGSYTCSCFDGGQLNNDSKTCSNKTTVINYHTVSSVEPSSIKGGNASFIGEFGMIHDNVTISIGTLNCPILNISKTVLICNAPAGSGIKTIVVSQNGLDFIGNEMYQYINENQKCPNQCSNNGQCLKTTGQCDCYSGFTSFDCSASNVNTSNTIDTKNGATTIKNEEIEFFIYFKSLLEFDFNGNIIKSYPLQNEWVINDTTTTSDNNPKYSFIQTLENGCKIISTIEEIQIKKDYSFAGTLFKLDKGDIKFSININNYTYKNYLNTLKLELITTIDQQQENKECNYKDTEINIINDDSSLFSYIKISKNKKVLFARFINRVISDGSPTFLSIIISNDTLSNSIITFNLPHCNECIIDPDFSLLIDPDFKTECGKVSRKWVIIVAVVVPVASLSIIAIAAYFLLKKNVGLRVGVAKLKKIVKNKS